MATYEYNFFVNGKEVVNRESDAEMAVDGFFMENGLTGCSDYDFEDVVSDLLDGEKVLLGLPGKTAYIRKVS